MDLPAEIKYGYVTDWVALAEGDGADTGRDPDARYPENLTVTFTPKTTALAVTGPIPGRVFPQPVTATIGNDGYLTDGQGAHGVWLVVGQYGVTYKHPAVPALSFTIEVTDAHTDAAPLYLSQAQPPGGTPLTPSEYAELVARIITLEEGGGSQGPKGDPGDPGASAYEVAVADGFVGDESTWLASLVGPKGDKGEQGPKGDDGAPGAPGADGEQGPKGDPGDPGASAYDVAVTDGFVGDESAWLASLVGPQGPQGEQGPQGPKGDTGDTGPKGDTGAPGADGADGTDGAQGPKGDKGDPGDPATVNLTTIPAGSTLTVHHDGSWPARPTARTDITVQWVDTTGTAGAPSGAIEGHDLVIVPDGA